MSTNRLLLLITATITVAALTFYFWPKPEVEDALPSMSQVLNSAEERASTLSLPQASPINIIDWKALMKQVASNSGLKIEVTEGNAQQAEITISAAPLDNTTNGLADLYARGLRVQSIRLLAADQPGWVRAEAVKLVVLQ